MLDEFLYDVFLSHSSKDKAVVRPLAERLRADGVKVWFDEWVLKPGDSLSLGERARVRASKFEEGLERSRVFPLAHRMGEGARRVGEGFVSANAFGSDWAQLESGTCGRGSFPFRDPLNKERRFLPLRPGDAPIKGGGAIPTPALLAKVVDMIEQVPMEERLQEYRIALITAAVIGKIDVRPNAGSNTMNS